MLRPYDTSLAILAELNAQDESGRTPVINAIIHTFTRPGRKAIITALILINDPAVDLTITDRSGKSPLDHARLYSKILLIDAINARMQREAAERAWNLRHRLFTPTSTQIPSANFNENDTENSYGL